MKLIKIASLTGLIISSQQLFAKDVENSQMIPASSQGAYHSVVKNTSLDTPQENGALQINPSHYQLHKTMPGSTIMLPEWTLKQQQMVKSDIEKMLKENTKRYKENEKKYVEYLKKSDELAKKRETEHRQWVEDNNKKIMRSWTEMLNQYAKNQQQQIESSENMPEWMKQQMLKQHDQQLAMMKNNPPIGRSYFQQMQQPAPQQMSRNSMQNFSQPQMRPMMNRMDMNYPPMPQRPQMQPYMGRTPMMQYNNFRR